MTDEEQKRLVKTAEDNPEWEHVWCAAQLAANTSMRGVEVKHVRRKDFDQEKRLVHIRTSTNQTSKRVIPLNDSAFDATQRMVKRSDMLGQTEPEHYLWCASQHHKLDPTKPASKSDTAWRALRDAAGLPACASTTFGIRWQRGCSRRANRITWSSRSPDTFRGECWSTIPTYGWQRRRRHWTGFASREELANRSARLSRAPGD